jgi:hypothetical protein
MAVGSGGLAVAFRAEHAGGLVLRGQKVLRLARGCEPAPDLLASSCVAMGRLATGVQPLVLAVVETGNALGRRGSRGPQRVGPHDTGAPANVSGACARPAFRRPGPVWAGPDCRERRRLRRSAPQPVGAPLDPDDELIKRPSVGRSPAVASGPGGKLVPEAANPLTDRFIGHRDAACRQEIFHVTTAQGEAMIGPDTVPDDTPWKPASP